MFAGRVATIEVALLSIFAFKEFARAPRVDFGSVDDRRAVYTGILATRRSVIDRNPLAMIRAQAILPAVPFSPLLILLIPILRNRRPR